MEEPGVRGQGSGGSGRSSNTSALSYVSFALSNSRSTFRVRGWIPARWHCLTQKGSWRNSCLASRSLGGGKRSG